MPLRYWGYEHTQAAKATSRFRPAGLPGLSSGCRGSTASTAPAAPERPEKPPERENDPAAVALGRKGGLKGGKARAEKLTAEERSEIGKRAAAKRWGKRT